MQEHITPWLQNLMSIPIVYDNDQLVQVQTNRRAKILYNRTLFYNFNHACSRGARADNTWGQKSPSVSVIAN